MCGVPLRTCQVGYDILFLSCFFSFEKLGVEHLLLKSNVKFTSSSHTHTVPRYSNRPIDVTLIALFMTIVMMKRLFTRWRKQYSFQIFKDIPFQLHNALFQAIEHFGSLHDYTFISTTNNSKFIDLHHESWVRYAIEILEIYRSTDATNQSPIYPY